MVLLVSILASSVVCATVFWLLSRVNTPHYRPSRSQARQLLQNLLLEQASEMQWRLFCDIPVRHDEQLEVIRAQCADIDERHFNGSRTLLSRAGLMEIQQLLERLDEGVQPHSKPEL